MKEVFDGPKSLILNRWLVTYHPKIDLNKGTSHAVLKVSTGNRSLILRICPPFAFDFLNYAKNVVNYNVWVSLFFFLIKSF